MITSRASTAGRAGRTPVGVGAAGKGGNAFLAPPFLLAALIGTCVGGVGLGCDQSAQPARASTMTVLADHSEKAINLYQTKFLLWLPLAHGDGEDGDPRLARSWEHTSDYRAWTYHLRDDVRWHDGVPVTAHDVAFSLELFAHPDVLFPGGWIWNHVDSISLPDDYTLTLYLDQPELLNGMGWTVYFPKHLLENLDPKTFYDWDFWTHPVGNGPYRFVRLVPKTALELEANPDFYTGVPAIDRVIVRFSSANPVTELTSGKADIAYNIAPSAALRLMNDPRFALRVLFDWSELSLIYWNQRHPLFADAAVRLALTHAIDRRGIARAMNLPDEMPLIGGLTIEVLRDRAYQLDGWDQGPAYDPALAARLLDRAGWIDRDGNGIRENAGREARFTLLARRGRYDAEAMAVLVQDQLQRVGVAAEIRSLDNAVARDEIRRGDFDAAISWLSDQYPLAVREEWFADPSPFGYFDTAAALLMDTIGGEVDPKVLSPLYLRLNRILRRDMPVTFLFPGIEYYAVNRRIRGMRPYGLLHFAEDLWIEEPR